MGITHVVVGHLLPFNISRHINEICPLPLTGW